MEYELTGTLWKVVLTRFALAPTSVAWNEINHIMPCVMLTTLYWPLYIRRANCVEKKSLQRIPLYPTSLLLCVFGVQFLNQATSMDGLKKSQGYAGSLLEHFYAEYGPAESAAFKAAQRKFMTSLAG